MPIKSAHLQNFTVFEDLHIQFSKGINVVIGTNGTGKTHLLKMMYGLCEKENDLNKEIFDIARPYFSVEPLQLIRNEHAAKITVALDDETSKIFEIKNHENTKSQVYEFSHGSTDFKVKSIFLPAKEMLSHSKGFLALYNKYKIP